MTTPMTAGHIVTSRISQLTGCFVGRFIQVKIPPPLLYIKLLASSWKMLPILAILKTVSANQPYLATMGHTLN